MNAVSHTPPFAVDPTLSAGTPVRSGYARTDDGVDLHWRAVGSGPLVACANGVGVSTFFWKYIVEHLHDRYTVVLWDYRGHGRSERRLDPTTTDMSVERHADDLAIVLDAVGPGPAVLLGHSMGCQVILELRRRHPERARALVLMLGTAGRALQTFFDFRWSPLFFHAAHRAAFRMGPALNELIRPLLNSPIAWTLTRRLALVDPYYARREDMLRYNEHLATLDMRLFLEAVIQTELHDAWDLLPVLDRPLLVIAAENDKFTPMWCSRKIVANTPGAELFVLAQASHAALIEQPETINHRLDRFLRERVESSAGGPAPTLCAPPRP